jgi:suppressor for copper-sensitivity B
MQKILYCLVFISLFLNINTSSSEEYNTLKMDMVEVSFISTLTKINKNNFYIGLEFNLKPDWKIYWRQPGDSGMPPTLDFSSSKNLKSFELQWPYPIKEWEAANILTNVYKNNVIIPIKLSVIDVTKTLYLNTMLSFQVCKDICIPIETNLFLKLYPGEAELTDKFHNIELALSKVPVEYKKTGIKNILINKHSKNALIINIENAINFPSGPLEVFLENGEHYIKILKINILENFNNNIKAKLVLEDAVDNYKKINITLVKGNLVASADSINIKESNFDSILVIIVMAFIGGFILNFMPCVLPVLTLKLSRILSNKYEDHSSIRFNFLLTTLGIVFSFICLAFITIGLKNITGEIGWGIQFQQPLFLFFLIFILIIFSLNLFNFLEINLPSNLSSNIHNYIKNKKHGIAFFEGAFATLLATPCSAPFLGTAVSFALSSSFYITLSIFIVLGIGMSFPYILFIAFPSLVRFLPKPGIWMVYLKYFLGFGVMLTAVWLGYVCIMIVGLRIFTVFILSIIILLLMFNKTINKNKYGFLLIALLIITVFFTYTSKVLDKYSLDFSNNSEWVKYNSDSLLNYINGGSTVFIDITADWCVTCKVNKLLILNSKEFKNIAKNNNLILMRGDWTKPDNKITQFLQKSNRYGIPFNALYNIKYPEGIIFSELLTLKEIKDSIKNMHISYAE